MESNTLPYLDVNWQEKGISLRALASELDCHHSIIGKIERGDRKLDFIEYVEYCQILI
jgi:hypothetical protein